MLLRFSQSVQVHVDDKRLAGCSTSSLELIACRGKWVLMKILEPSEVNSSVLRSIWATTKTQDGMASTKNLGLLVLRMLWPLSSVRIPVRNIW